MRLDKFLKVSRLIKRRTLAKEVTDAGKVALNGKVAKPSAEVQVGDILTIGFGARQVKAEILAIKESVRAEEAADLYRIIVE